MYSQIINLAVQSGDSLVEFAGQIEDIGISKKYLTEKDLEIERHFTKLINSFPGRHSIFAEEENSSLVDSQNLWVIDPISNTFNFVHGFPHYAVVVSHIYNGETVFALVYDPSSKELFIAEKNKGATLNDQKISVNSRTQDHCLMYEFSSSKTTPEKGFALMKELNEIGKVKKSFGSMALHYAYVACGRASGAVTVNRDTFPEIAGDLLVREAGGQATDFKGNTINLETVGVVFSNGFIHKDLVEVTKDLF